MHTWQTAAMQQAAQLQGKPHDATKHCPLSDMHLRLSVRQCRHVASTTLGWFNHHDVPADA